jgi:hypothetical protein
MVNTVNDEVVGLGYTTLTLENEVSGVKLEQRGFSLAVAVV